MPNTQQLTVLPDAAEAHTRNRPVKGTAAGVKNGARRPGDHCHTCADGDAHDQWNAGARGETPLQRLDRAYSEILQEVRVAQTGVQILLAFLLTLAFSTRFASITHFQRDVYLATVVLGAGATALLIAPAAFHRMVYRKRLKRQLVRIANRLALFGLLLLLATMGSALLLIFDIVIGMHPAMVLTTGTLGWFATWWFILPVWTRIRHQGCRQLRDTDPDLPGSA